MQGNVTTTSITLIKTKQIQIRDAKMKYFGSDQYEFQDSGNAGYKNEIFDNLKI